MKLFRRFMISGIGSVESVVKNLDDLRIIVGKGIYTENYTPKELPV